jgi:Kdo2-lipid IVA lauroyltransferase/acyltransferase
MESLPPIIQNIRYYASLAVIRTIRYLPYSFVLQLFRFLSMFAWIVDPFHKKVAEIQMRSALDLAHPGPHVLKVFMNQATILVDAVKYAYLSDSEIRKRVVVEGREHLDEALAGGKGVMMITGHIGNWEILFHLPRILGVQFCVMADMRKDAKLESIVNTLRSRSGATILPPTGKALMLVKELKKGNTIGMVVDNRGEKKDAFFCMFLGMPALTNPAPAFIAVKGEAIVLPVFVVKLDGVYHIRFHKAVDATAFGHGKKAIQALSDYMQFWVSSVVKKYPEQWFWLYSRWLRRPDIRDVIKQRLDFKETVLHYGKEISGSEPEKHSKS